MDHQNRWIIQQIYMIFMYGSYSLSSTLSLLCHDHKSSSLSIIFISCFFVCQVYASANQLFAMAHQFDKTSRIGPKVLICVVMDIFFFFLFI